MISTKARYALRVMIDLAEHQDAGYIPLKDIAARQEISENIVGDIIELTEGSLAPVACLQPDAEVCNRKDICVTLPLWEKYYTLVHDFFFHITLEDVINNNF